MDSLIYEMTGSNHNFAVRIATPFQSYKLGLRVTTNYMDTIFTITFR